MENTRTKKLHRLTFEQLMIDARHVGPHFSHLSSLRADNADYAPDE